MLKRLFFAVLLLGLFLAFNGIAFADYPNGNLPQNRIKVVQPTPRETPKEFSTLPDVTGSVQRPGVDLEPYGSFMPLPSADHLCGPLSYWDPTGTGYQFTMPGDDISIYAVRFDVLEPKNHITTLYGASIYFTLIGENGAPDITINVYENDGGVPGTILYTETFAAGSFVEGWNYFGFASEVDLTGEFSYFIGYETGGTQPADKYVKCGISQNADGTDYGRSLGYWVDTWYGMVDFFGIPLNFLLAANVCGEYTACYDNYSLAGGTGIVGIWAIPDPAWDIAGTLNGFGAIMSNPGNDTVKSVTIQHLLPTAAQAFGWWGSDSYPSTATNGMEVSIWADDGSGNMDVGSGPLATEVISGISNLFPYTGNDYATAGTYWDYVTFDFSAYNLVIRGNYHVTAKMTSNDQADGMLWLSINSAGDNPGFTGGSVNFTDGVTDPNWERFTDSYFWMNSAYTTNVDQQFSVHVEVCADEFAKCEHQSTYFSDFADYGYTQDEESYNIGLAQAIKPLGWASLVSKVRFYCEVKAGTPGVRLIFYDDNGTSYTGLPCPGDILWDTALAVANNGWNEVDIPQLNQSGIDVGPGFYVEGGFYVGYEVIQNGADSLDDALYAITNEDPNGLVVNGGAFYYHRLAGPAWISIYNYWESPENALIDVDFCSIPNEEKICGDDDWITMQHDFQRTGHSGVDLGDAKCYLTYEWDTISAFGNAQWVGPIIYNGKLITTFKTTTGCEYTVRDLMTKAIEYTFTFTGEVRGMPTAYYVEALDKDVLFVTGGTSADVVQAIDLDTGDPIWTIAADGSVAVPGAPTDMASDEINQFSNFIVLNDGTDDVLFFTTTAGKVYAVYAADGTDYWGTPYQYPGFGSVNNRTGATDGVSRLFYGYQTTAGGDVVCLDAFSGTENWLLSTDGFHGNDAYGGGVISESFQAGMSVDTDPEFQKLYALSTVTGAEPREAVIYQIDYSTGKTTGYNVSNAVGFYITPVIDKSRVIVPTFSTLTAPVNEATIQSYSKADMSLEWGEYFGDLVYSDVFNSDMLLTCEPEGAVDLLFGMDYYGYLRCIDVSNGEEYFHRRIDYGSNAGTRVDTRGGNGALGNDTTGATHLVWQSIFGVYDLVMGTEERARLQLSYYANRAPVPFGTDANYEVVFPEVYTNTGCVDLTADIVISDVSNGIGEPPLLTVPSDLSNQAQALASRLTDAGQRKVLGDIAFSQDIASQTYQVSNEKALVNPAALADMSWINTPTISTTTAPGDISDITVYVNQGLVGRGVFHFYAAFTNMNDNDYWLNVNMGRPAPEVRLDFIGGCLVEMTELAFGDGSSNTQYVFNTGRLATNADDGNTYGYYIDGGNPYSADEPPYLPSLFAGNYTMGVSEHRLALSNKSWLQGSTEADAWVSWLPDLYNGECVPELTEGVQLGSWSDDGISYHPIYGNVAENNSLDSVQNFEQPDGSWWWDDYTAPYDNDSTMGLAVHHRHIGVYDFGQGSSDILQYIGNATVEIMDYTERNGNSVPGWYLGSYLDYDMRSSQSLVDTTLWDPSIAMGWSYCKQDPNPRPVAGMMTLPFNFCSNPADPYYQEGMLNAMAISQRQGMWGSTHVIPYLDSAYLYMSRGSGLFSQTPLVPADDMASSFTFAHHDFGPHETYTVATAYFEFQDYTTPTTSNGRMRDLAFQLNKWMGYSRGDVNNDNKIDLADIIYLANYVNYGGPGPIPFVYLGNLNGASTGAGIDMVDVMYLVNYYFNEGPCPEGILKNTGKATDAADY